MPLLHIYHTVSLYSVQVCDLWLNSLGRRKAFSWPSHNLPSPLAHINSVNYIILHLVIINLFYPCLSPYLFLVCSSLRWSRIRDGLIIEPHTSSQLLVWLSEDLAKILKLFPKGLLISWTGLSPAKTKLNLFCSLLI